MGEGGECLRARAIRQELRLIARLIRDNPDLTAACRYWADRTCGLAAEAAALAAGRPPAVAAEVRVRVMRERAAAARPGQVPGMCARPCDQDTDAAPA